MREQLKRFDAVPRRRVDRNAAIILWSFGLDDDDLAIGRLDHKSSLVMLPDDIVLTTRWHQLFIPSG